MFRIPNTLFGFVNLIHLNLKIHSGENDDFGLLT